MSKILSKTVISSKELEDSLGFSIFSFMQCLYKYNLASKLCGYCFGLSTNGTERKDNPLHYLECLSELIMSNSYITLWFKTFGSLKLRRTKCFGQKTFGHGLMPKLFCPERFDVNVGTMNS